MYDHDITEEQIDAAIQRAARSTRAAFSIDTWQRLPWWTRLWEWIRP